RRLVGSEMCIRDRLIFFELTILTSVAILFSSFSTPALSALLTFLIFLIGHLSSSLRDFAATLGSAFAEAVFELVYYLLPNLSLFAFRTEAAHGMVPNAAMIFGSAAYAVVYITIVLTVAVLVFSRRNFK
ncbi:MAG: hypothetical protein QUS14_03070, partial [Pyrinomonadaceae bacterium]|nr:hypothetical protein [Pyrinomonadaceae bacterium]